MNEPQVTPAVNDGWEDIITDVDAFYNEETCPVVTGKVTSITNMKLAGRDTEVAVILLTKPCKGVTGKKEDKEEVQLEPGQAIGVVVKHKLTDLYSMLPNQCEVEITAKDKLTLDNGNTMWRYGLRCRGRRVLNAAPRAQPAAPAQTESPEREASKAMAAF
jgi:hypothetical protein